MFARSEKRRLSSTVDSLVYEYLPCVEFLAQDLINGSDDAETAVERYISETVSEPRASKDVRAAAREIANRLST